MNLNLNLNRIDQESKDRNFVPSTVVVSDDKSIVYVYESVDVRATEHRVRKLNHIVSKGAASSFYYQ